MEDLLIAILCLAVIALAVKLNRLDSDSTQLAELRDLIHRLEQRLGGLERQFHSQSFLYSRYRETILKLL